MVKTPIIESLESIEPERLEWLWPDRIPLGKISLVVGDPGLGKSLLTLYMAAQVSSGRPWVDCPGGTKPARVLIISAEDDFSDTIVPRLIAAGAYMRNIHRIKAIAQTEDPAHPKTVPLTNLTADYDVLVNTARKLHPDLKLVIIDPITAFMQGKNENKNAEVREYLAPLANLAKVANLAIVGISHMNKNQLTQSSSYRILGSIGFIAAVRSAWLVSKDPDNETNRLFVPLKANLAKKKSGLSYKLINTPVQTKSGGTVQPYCSFSLDPIEISADELLAPKPVQRYSKKDDAAEWLKAFLSTGPKFASEIFKEATESGFSEKTIRRAKKKLSIQSIQSFDPATNSGGWEWSLESIN